MYTIQELEKLIQGFEFKERRERKIGIEDEIPIVRADGSPGDMLPVLLSLVEKKGWQPQLDDVTLAVVGASHPDYGVVTTDAGSSIMEWASPVNASLFCLAEGRAKVIQKINALTHDEPQFLLGTGRHPLLKGSAAHWAPKGRYKVLTEAVGTKVHVATEMASQQVTIDGLDAADSIKLLDDFLAISPLLNALTANSSVYHGRVHPAKLASRQLAWRKLAAERTGIPDQPYRSFEKLARRLWNSVYLFRHAGAGKYEAVKAIFGDYLTNGARGELSAHLLVHEGCMWEDARWRFKIGAVEMRQCCQQPKEAGMAVPALMFGLAENRSDRETLVAQFGWDKWRQARDQAARFGMYAKVGNVPIKHLLKQMLIISESGLKSRRLKEEVLLEPLFERLQRGSPPALNQIKAFKYGGITGLIKKFALY